MGFAQGNTHSHQRSGYDSMMRSNAKAAAIMTKRGIQRSSSLARTAAALSVDEELSDDEIERSLREEDAPKLRTNPVAPDSSAVR